MSRIWEHFHFILQKILFSNSAITLTLMYNIFSADCYIAVHLQPICQRASSVHALISTLVKLLELIWNRHNSTRWSMRAVNESESTENTFARYYDRDLIDTQWSLSDWTREGFNKLLHMVGKVKCETKWKLKSNDKSLHESQCRIYWLSIIYSPNISWVKYLSNMR